MLKVLNKMYGTNTLTPRLPKIAQETLSR